MNQCVIHIYQRIESLADGGINGLVIHGWVCMDSCGFLFGWKEEERDLWQVVGER